MEDSLQITRNKQYGWRYSIKGVICGVVVDINDIDPIHYDTTMIELMKLIELKLNSKKIKV